MGVYLGYTCAIVRSLYLKCPILKYGVRFSGYYAPTQVAIVCSTFVYIRSEIFVRSSEISGSLSKPWVSYIV